MPLIDSAGLFAAALSSNSYDTAGQVVVGTDFYVTVNEEKFTTDTYEFRFGIDNGFGTEMMITVPIGRSSTITNAQNESIPYHFMLKMICFLVQYHFLCLPQLMF